MIRPIKDCILVKRDKQEERSKGGIIIPDAAKEKSVEATVLAVGSGVLLQDGRIHPLDVKQGDRVLLGKYGGVEVKVDGEDLLMLREAEVLGVIES
jgi:chaperonin GroES